MKSVYVAAPYADALKVRALHTRMRLLGLRPTSTWAEAAAGAEDFSKFTPEQLRQFALSNDSALLSSDFVVVLARDGAGGEMFAEARLALDRGIAVYWVGRRTLSAWREGVTLADDIDDAIAGMLGLQKTA